MALTKISGSILKDPLNLGEVSIGGTLTYQDVTNVDSVGIITARSTIDAQGDISIADKIIHTGDTNTAIRFPSADTISAETGGTERLRIDSSGRVLIGTTTEGHENADDLTIATSGTGGITIRTGSSNSGTIYFSDATSGTAEYAGFVGYSHANNSMTFGTNGAEKLRIMSNGYFGFGINSPSRRIHVHTSGSGGDYMQFTNDTTGTTDGDGYVFGINANEDVIHNNLEATNTIFFTSGAERLRIESGGDLRLNNADSIIHTSADTSKLRIFGGSTNSTTNGAALALHGVNNSSGNYAVLAAGAGGFIRFSSGTTERFHIATDGELTSTANNNGQIIHSFKNDNTTAGSSAMTVEHWFRFNRSGGGMNASAARIIAGKEREWIGGASNQDGYFAVHTTADETSSEKMRISSGGIMTRPFQPAFSARGNSSPVDSSEGYTGILSNYMTTMTCNIGSHYKTSGSDIGNFVAPVAGNYFFSAGCLIRLRNSSSAGFAELTFHKNGSNISARSLGYSYVVGSNDHDNITINSIISLAAGDKVALVAYQCSSVVDWYWGEGLGNFHGYLIG